MAGFFISFEGIDGSGKSTQARVLAEALEAGGHTICLTREPGGSVGAEEIRALLVNGPPNRWSANVELLLFNAARLDHLEKKIRPALARGEIVLCDRFHDSTAVYQGLAGEEMQARVENIHNLMIHDIPDMTFLIDISAQEGLCRARQRAGQENRFEDMGAPFLSAARQAFLARAAMAPERFHVLDGGQSPAVLSAQILDITLKALPR